VLHDCAGVIDEIYPLYRTVAERSEVNFETFSREYFLEAGRRSAGRFRYFIWRLEGKVVAFSFCTVHGDTIYDNDIGLDYTVAHDLNLYYVTFRDIIEWALAHGLRRYCSAPFNYDPQIAPFFAPAKSDPVLRRHAAEMQP